ncbi:c-type cytochrome [Pusillimonas sp. ANT_WB101]|uniref:c-type cytochrome n=1 Tax=Pusillimonas sp. ANT_WB101 TaxID=2597356 RepID=UPI0021064ACF|nr:c-type cytochrome [Pusillimonas sp. ANT_WB101]
MYITTKTGLACAAMALAGLWSTGAVAQDTKTQTATNHAYGFGTNITEADLKEFTSPLPDGRGMPKGTGTVMQGEKIYMQQCLACHGAKLEGGIGDRLIGGRGSLTIKDGVQAPIKTVESYWPYATTLFDYVKRAMPFTTPNSMSDDDVYAVTAYILSQAHIIPADATLDQDSMPKVQMPNRDGFTPANR